MGKLRAGRAHEKTNRLGLHCSSSTEHWKCMNLNRDVLCGYIYPTFHINHIPMRAY